MHVVRRKWPGKAHSSRIFLNKEQLVKKYIFFVVIVLFLIITIGFGLELLGVKWFSYIAPKKENARREVFEKTKSYNESKEQDLIRYYHQWKVSNDDNEKEAIESTVRLMFADYDENVLSSELRFFLKDCKY